MLGAIIGDIVGSKYEFTSDKTKEFELFTADSCLTDDSMMTIAVGCACAKADLSDGEDFKSWVIYYMRKIGRQYPFAGYGYHFFRWIKSDFMGAYNSFGNGSAMRVSPVAWVAQSLEEAEKLLNGAHRGHPQSPRRHQGRTSRGCCHLSCKDGKIKSRNQRLHRKALL